MQVLRKQFRAVFPAIPDDFKERLCDNMHEAECCKNEWVLCEGQKHPYILFIRSGTVQCSYFEGEREIIVDFFVENDFVVFPPCWPMPGSLRVKAIECCSFFRLSFQRWEILARDCPWQAMLMENTLLRRDRYSRLQQLYMLRTPSAEGALDAFRQAAPRIYAGISTPLKASYIGRSEQTVRRVVAAKKRKKGC